VYHNRFSCPILKDHGCILHGDLQTRERVVKNILSKGGCLLSETLVEVAEPVYESLPKTGVMGLILCKRYIFEGNVLVRASPVCLGGVNVEYKEALFALGPIMKWVLTHTARPLVNAIPEVDDAEPSSIAASVTNIFTHIGQPGLTQQNRAFPINGYDSLSLGGSTVYPNDQIGNTIADPRYEIQRQRMASIVANQNALILGRANTASLTAAPPFSYPPNLLQLSQHSQAQFYPLSQLSQNTQSSVFQTAFGSTTTDIGDCQYDLTRRDDGVI
jgi:hypothetical protein